MRRKRRKAHEPHYVFRQRPYQLHFIVLLYYIFVLRVQREVAPTAAALSLSLSNTTTTAGCILLSLLLLCVIKLRPFALSAAASLCHLCVYVRVSAVVLVWQCAFVTNCAAVLRVRDFSGAGEVVSFLVISWTCRYSQRRNATTSLGSRIHRNYVFKEQASKTLSVCGHPCR